MSAVRTPFPFCDLQTVSLSHSNRMLGMAVPKCIQRSPVFVPSGDMTEVMISSTPMEDMRLSPSKDRLSFQIFPDPSDFERYCKLKDRLPSIVVEPTEGEVESGELRWPPEEFIVSEEEEENHGKSQTGQPTQNNQH
ncbi:protein LBH isoform X1 [Esox lucius]|uniref:Protein LBH n=1 Tax=Esox lucius TaxID=8010 RepID=A0AAY5L6Z7_ESOLU|nr:protein LBH isoform X1 [Esox lucius]